MSSDPAARPRTLAGRSSRFAAMQMDIGNLVSMCLPPHPESVAINMLVQVEGTPLHGTEPLDSLSFVRTIAVARILMPQSYVRLSAGRTDMSDETQALCFLAGANSIFYGDRLLTTDNPEADHDRALFGRLGLNMQENDLEADRATCCGSGDGTGTDG